jgi:hypothetical protein
VKTTILMTLSAALMFALGVVLTFLPQETLTYLGGEPLEPLVLLLQVTGALYLGFAMLNWMARATILGGIYNRPIVLGNFLHFAAVAAALLKAVAGGQRNEVVLAAALGYTVFAAWFGFILFSHPRQQPRPVSSAPP